MREEREEAELTDVARLVGRLLRQVRGPMDDMPEAVHAMLGAPGLGNRHLAPLIALAVDGPASVGTLAGRIGLGATTTSQLVNELHRAGLLERREDDADRRRMIVSVAEPHRSLIEHCARLRMAPLRHALDTLPAGRRREFIGTLDEVVSAMEAAGGDADGRPAAS
ncbi:MarR family transcriptional regulator [Streptomyces sp. NPDC048172]|uniref:MarR family transcriptional regulator n=1 Tax=Streptomyces sp. NPDC048172 TaxID=3365505 RepID=UPI0037159650